MQRDPKIPVCVVIPTKNEEASILDCLASVQAFDQVIVVDSESPDRTQELSRAAGADVVPYRWDGRYPKKKQWCLDNLPLRHDWVLFIDGDERPSEELVRAIEQVTQSGKIDQYAAFDLDLEYHFLGRPLRHGHQVVKRALVHRERAVFPEVKDLDAPGMGEQEGHYQPTAEGNVGRLRGRLVHNDPDPFATWVARHNRYSDWEAYLQERPKLAHQVQQLRSRRARRYRDAPFKPVAFFLYSYVLRRGFLDGAAGFHYAVSHAFYFWMISVKRRERQQLPRQERRHVIDINSVAAKRRQASRR